VLLAFNQYTTGLYSDAQVANMLTEEGYRATGNFGARSFSKDTVRPLLQNRFYLGETQYKGKSYPGRHPMPMLSPSAGCAQCGRNPG